MTMSNQKNQKLSVLKDWNWKTSLSAVLAFLLMTLNWFEVFGKDTAQLVDTLAAFLMGVGLLYAADGSKIKKRFALVLPIMLSFALSSCNQAMFNAHFDSVVENVPLQKVVYKVPELKKDTLYQWQSPYGIFQNTFIKTDSGATYTEELNFDQVKLFLWQKIQEAKAKKEAKKRRKQEVKPDTTIKLSSNMSVKQVFLEVQKELLSDLSELKQCDLYNRQYERDADDTPILTPSVFVEFGEVLFDDVGKARQIGQCDIVFHVVSERFSSSSEPNGLKHLDLLEQVHSVLQGWRCCDSAPFRRLRMQVANNFDTVLVSKITYKTSIVDICERIV